VAVFVTLDQAKRRLRLTSTAEDEDLQDIIDQAEARVVSWCSLTPRSKAITDTWLDPSSTPDQVILAVLLQTAELYRFRGDDVDGPPRESGEELSTPVRELLRPFHDPVVA
jgi:hypothetical protein